MKSFVPRVTRGGDRAFAADHYAAGFKSRKIATLKEVLSASETGLKGVAELDLFWSASLIRQSVRN